MNAAIQACALPLREEIERPRVLEDRLARPDAAGDHPGDAVGVLERGVDGGPAAHRDPDEDGALDLQRVEQGDHVVAEPRLGGGRRPAVAAGVGRNDAPLGERVELRPPHPVVDRAAVQEHERRGARTRVAVDESDVLVGEGEALKVFGSTQHDNQGVICLRF